MRLPAVLESRHNARERGRRAYRARYFLTPRQSTSPLIFNWEKNRPIHVKQSLRALRVYVRDADRVALIVWIGGAHGSGHHHVVAQGGMLPVEDPVLEANGAIDNLEGAHAWVDFTVKFLCTVCVSNIHLIYLICRARCTYVVEVAFR